VPPWPITGDATAIRGRLWRSVVDSCDADVGDVDTTPCGLAWQWATLDSDYAGDWHADICSQRPPAAGSDGLCHYHIAVWRDACDGLVPRSTISPAWTWPRRWRTQHTTAARSLVDNIRHRCAPLRAWRSCRTRLRYNALMLTRDNASERHLHSFTHGTTNHFWPQEAHYNLHNAVTYIATHIHCRTGNEYQVQLNISKAIIN